MFHHFSFVVLLFLFELYNYSISSFCLYCKHSIFKQVQLPIRIPSTSAKMCTTVLYNVVSIKASLMTSLLTFIVKYLCLHTIELDDVQ